MTAAFDSLDWLLFEPATMEAILLITEQQPRLLNGKFEVSHFVTSLGMNPPDGDFAQAITTLQALNDEAVRDLLAQAARDKNVRLDLPDDIPIQELVGQLWLKAYRGDQNIAEVLVLARSTASDLLGTKRRAYREFIGDYPLQKKLDKEAVESAVRKWFQDANKDYESIAVVSYERNGVFMFNILRGDPVKRVTEIRNKRPSVLNYQPARTDSIRYEPSSGRIGIATRSAVLFGAYQSILGKLAADSEEFFKEGNVCTLAPLVNATNAIFQAYVGGVIRRVSVKQLRWQGRQGESFIVKGADCFEVLTRLGTRINEGALTDAVLSVSLSGQTRAARVVIKAPNHIDIYGAGVHEDAVLSLLSAVGIRGSSMSAEAPVDLWSLYPHVFNEPEWRRILGLQFDGLFKQQILVPTQLTLVTHPEHTDRPNALEVIPLDNGRAVGVDPDQIVPMRVLSPTDTLGYGVDWVAQGLVIAKALELQGAPKEIESGLWQLGQRDFHSGSIMTVFLATRSPQAHWAAVLRLLVGPDSVLIIPTGCSTDIDCTVPMSLPSFNTDGLLERCIGRLGWQQRVPPHEWISADLVFCRSTGRIWYKRKELTAVKPGTHPYKFALALAEAGGGFVSKRELEKVISEDRQDDQVCKHAKRNFIKAAIASYGDGEGECPREELDALFQSSTAKGFALRVSVRIV